MGPFECDMTYSSGAGEGSQGRASETSSVSQHG